MIDFDYVLTVDMKTSTPEYRPDPNMPTHICNIFKMSGPNSSGKSTFMNVVALATHGLKNPSISDSIKARMEDLVEADYKTLEFSLRMEDPVSKTVLRACKKRDSKDITLYESINGEKEKVLSPDPFLRKYKLIYDIPENPTGRIRELASELKEWQKGYSDYFSNFQNYVDDVYKTVKASRDEIAISEKGSALKVKKEELARLLSNDKNAEIDSLTKLILAKKLYKARKERNDAETDFNKVKHHLKPISGQDADSIAKSNFSSKFRDMKNCVENIITSSRIVKDQRLDDILDRLEPVTSIGQISEKDNFNKYVSDLEKLIACALSMNDPPVDNEARMVNDLLIVLNKYRGEVNFVSGIGSLNEIIAALEKTASSRGDNSAKRKAIDSIKSNAQTIHGSLTTFKGAFSKMKEPQSNADDNMYMRALEFERSYKLKNEKLNQLLQDGKQYGLNLENMAQMIQYFREQLGGKYSSDKIEELENCLKTLKENSADKEDLRNLNVDISTAQAELDKLKSAETHEYKGKESIITRISNETQKLRGSYKSAQGKIDAVLNNQYGSNDPKDPFFESVWNYFGSRLGFVQHLQKSYEVEKVNFIDDLIITKDGTIIHMKDMGTGQGQLTYLLGLLSTDENKIIIAMFDEVAAMSPGTLNKIFDRFEELQKEGKLMLGMTVLPGDEFIVTQYGLTE